MLLAKRGGLRSATTAIFTNAVLLCELELRIGSYVVIGWNTVIADTDFHPLSPAERIADAVLVRRPGEDGLDPPSCAAP